MNHALARPTELAAIAHWNRSAVDAAKFKIRTIFIFLFLIVTGVLWYEEWIVSYKKKLKT